MRAQIYEERVKLVQSKALLSALGPLNSCAVQGPVVFGFYTGESSSVQMSNCKTEGNFYRLRTLHKHTFTTDYLSIQKVAL